MAQNKAQEKEILVNEKEDKEIEQFIQGLPKADFMGCNKVQLVNHQNYWFLGYPLFKNILKCQKQFNAQDTDLIIASHPKTGTTWLNALLYEVVNRVHRPVAESPLFSHHPHHLVTRLENVNYGGGFYNHHTSSNLSDIPSPRLFSTHFPYVSLPESIKVSGCRILYICRNPLDTFVSQWHFYPKAVRNFGGDPDSKHYGVEDYFEDFCQGRTWYGPFFEHVLEYWKQSLENPHKILFLKYEDLKEDPKLHLKKIADFVSMSFSHEEESGGVINEIIEMCNIKTMQNLDANKSGAIYTGSEKKAFFRKGEVGDWTNYFSPPMLERMNKLMQQKFEGTGLSFKLFP